jgi:MEMO1 family protein
MQADKLVDSARLYHNACGAGAVAASVAVASEAGVEKGYLLAHTTSAEVVASKFGQSSQDSVGYAAIVYG